MGRSWIRLNIYYTGVRMGEEKEKKLGFFERTAKMPCVNETLMTGILSGLGVGLLKFLTSSNVSKATSYGYYTFIILPVIYFPICRSSKKEQVMRREISLLEEYVPADGMEESDATKQLKAKIKELEQQMWEY